MRIKICLKQTLNDIFFFLFKGNVGDEDGGETIPRNTSHHSQSAPSLFPSSLCSAIVQIIHLLDDAAVSDDGSAVYEVAYQVKKIFRIIFERNSIIRVLFLEKKKNIHNASVSFFFFFFLLSGDLELLGGGQCTVPALRVGTSHKREAGIDV